jgi:hypothetical protein
MEERILRQGRGGGRGTISVLFFDDEYFSFPLAIIVDVVGFIVFRGDAGAIVVDVARNVLKLWRLKVNGKKQKRREV